MNLVDSYLNSYGYNYYGNAAEDTLVFFVHDEDAPTAEPGGKSNEAITNFSENAGRYVLSGLLKESAAANTKTKTEVYSDAPVPCSMAAPGSNAEEDCFSQSFPEMAEMDAKQMDTKHSTDAGFKA